MLVELAVAEQEIIVDLVQMNQLVQTAEETAVDVLLVQPVLLIQAAAVAAAVGQVKVAV